MLGQHHPDGTVLARKSDLDHLPEQPVLLLAVVAFVGKLAKECAEVRHVLAWNLAAGLERFGHEPQ